MHREVGERLHEAGIAHHSTASVSMHVVGPAELLGHGVGAWIQHEDALPAAAIRARHGAPHAASRLLVDSPTVLPEIFDRTLDLVLLVFGHGDSSGSCWCLSTALANSSRWVVGGGLLRRRSPAVREG